MGLNPGYRLTLTKYNNCVRVCSSLTKNLTSFDPPKYKSNLTDTNKTALGSY